MGTTNDNALQEPLLPEEHAEPNTAEGEAQHAAVDVDDCQAPLVERKTLDEASSSSGQLIKDVLEQASLAWPLVLNLLAAYATSVINMGFVGHISKEDLAGAALGNSFVGITARYVLQGLCGALDTQASQAHGAGNTDAIGPIFKRTVLFLWLHCLPVSGLLLGAPVLLQYLSKDVELAYRAHQYIVALLPAVWLDALARPLNRILVAQRITKPQMYVSLLIVPLHVAANYGLIFTARLGFVGAALAMAVANGLNCVLTIAYILWAGLGRVVFGGGWGRVMQGWGAMVKLAYPAMVMKCAESWGFSAMTLLAGRLPDPETSVAAISVGFSTCAVLYMPFAAFSMTACAQVGNSLGAGDGAKARTAAIASCWIGPLMWLAGPSLLLLRPVQTAVIALFTNSQDPALLTHLHALMYLVAAVNLFDGTQTILTGVIQGAGKQRYGLFVNLGVFYAVAVPLALLLGFWAGWGVEGMWTGMLAGPVLQVLGWGVIMWLIKWPEEAAKAASRAARR